MKYLHIALLLFAGILCGSAQNTLFYSSDKLSNSGINDICQDGKGYIWIATEYGLNRFDGYRFTPFLNQPQDSTSLCYNVVCCVVCDAKGRLWVGTSKGLQRYDYATGTFVNYHFPDGLHPRISDILECHDGRMLFGTAGYDLYTLDEGTGQLREVPEAKANESDSYFLFLYEDGKGGLWRASANNYSYKPAGQGLIQFDNPPYGVPTAFFDYQGQTVIVCRDGLQVYDGQQLRDVPFDTSEAGRNPGFRTAITDRQGNVYLGTRGNGLYWLPAGTRSLRRYPFSVQGYDLNASKIWALAEDRQGNIWVGCQQKGMLMIPQRKPQFSSWNFAAQRVEIGTFVSSVAEGDNGVTWCTVQNKGVYGFGADGQLVSHPNAPDDVEFIYRDKQRHYWLGTSHAVFEYDPATGSRQMLTDFDCDKFNDMTDNGQGTLVFSAFAKGILVYDQSTGTIEHHSMHHDDDPVLGRLPNDWVMQLMPDRDGLIWIGTSNGVGCYDPRTHSFKPFGWNLLAEDRMCYSLCETPDGDILIGLEQGLCIWRRATNTLEEFPAEGTPLQSLSISYIVQDNDGDFWCATQNGLWQYSQRQKQWQGYISGSGLTTREYISGVGMHDSSDRIFFATAEGLTTFTSQQVRSVQPKPGQLLLTAFYIDGHSVTTKTESDGRQVTEQPVDESTYFTVSYLDNSVLLEFSLLNYENAENTIIEHRLGSGQWTANEVGKNSVSLTHLASGTYQLEVRAVDNGVASSPITITIVVRPPWYRSTLAYIIYTLLLLALLATAVYLWRRRMRRRQDEDKMKFLINATHDIRSPLTLIMGALKKLKGSDAADSPSVDAIERNTDRILKLVNQILDVRKIDKQQMKLHCQLTDMHALLKSISKVYEYSADERNITFTLPPQPQEPVMAWVDRTQFDKVVSNLLSNAFKFCSTDGTVAISLSTGHDDRARGALKDYVEVSISDTGKGMSSETLDHLFERFFSSRDRNATHSEGTGIGLNLCKMIVDMHHGSIVGRNRDDGQTGSVFTVRLPQGRDHLSEAEIDENDDTPVTAVHINNKKQPTSHHHILIADDDEEIARYIADELGPYYHFTTCPNGREALKELLAPTTGGEDMAYDLVISDVMMPEMDGFTMLRMLRANINIAHLPVIMLTSKGDIGNRLEGLEKGADAYLTKPFNIDELHATINNLISMRLRLRGKYSGQQSPQGKIQNIEMKGNDELLMERVIKSINDHLSDSDFSVDTLCAEAGISRAHLHRKMKDMTGIAISEFIRNIRMEQAARLLRQQKVNISQVAYSVGYSSLPYFSAVFRKHYGMSPREYAEQQHE